ncbi:maltose phosphorylase/trehalose phosphorylase [Tetragenococcus muriaticus PMC-11-5]|uniref:Maltose phosphorylase/trehalose phosphorylase n=1 Tax=Tetragenococcus muriaticus PMC-11-5 TaxID=1302649 RepID=A0A091C946_9ENTE|nr:glycoside hydrolase family 65 protein [Tetragenococcus muriaticus]KFN93569.1 maltose phosphorylase/trehalose phosphorylase [Tetragenococcus muriaticus PMC-11-5]GMA48330.1 maltose phosphorylase [Tetragenococcus muriaticus]
MEATQHTLDIHPWKITTTTLDKDQRRLHESITSLGNGYMGMRGNFEEHYSGDHHLGTYLAGIWFPDKTRVGWWKNGYPDYYGKVINAVNFAALDLFVNDVRIDLDRCDYEDFYLELNMYDGILFRQFTVNLGNTKVKFAFERFISIIKKELAYITMEANVLKGEAKIEVISKLDNNVQNEDSNYGEMFWEERNKEVIGDSSFLTTQTVENPFDVEQFVVTSSMRHNLTPTKIRKEPLAISNEFIFSLDAGQTVRLEKEIIIVTSRDIIEEKQIDQAQNLLQSFGNDFSVLKAEHSAAWHKRWELADVTITGDDAAQQGIRFNLFQLFSTYYGEDERLNIGPKGFTGEKYGGATYWDTEAYAISFYLALADPKVTKNLLKYRYNQLPQAYYNADKQGIKGALYPMVTFNGIECHNEWEITFEEIHRNGAIAYAIYNYTNYTGDPSYLKNEGLEVLIAISRFWADRVHFSQRNNAYMIHGVTGPNEYENNVNNNWYTNKIATWTLQYTLDNYKKYKSELSIKLPTEELNTWQEIIDHMYFPSDEKLGIFVQHDTFLDKKLQTKEALNEKELPLSQHWSWDRILRSCFIKQADVLQGLYFFGDQYTLKEKAQNFNFYEPMTVHESSLSACVHAILAAELKKIDKALEMYQRTARLDLDNYNNDTQEGLHVTSMTGSWLSIVHGFAQMKTFGESLSFAPLLPKKWQSYAFHINYRHRLLFIKVTTSSVELHLVSGQPLSLTVYQKPYTLTDNLTIAV